jgi:polar amino acid transport system substrate-binding protein
MIKQLCRLFLTLLMCFSVNVHADKIENILERGTLKVAVALFEPWTMQDEAGELTGFEIDVARNIAHEMGVTPEFIVYEWEDIIPALEKGEIDVIAGGMAITPARALRISYSRPYSESGISLATNIELTKHIQQLDELDQPEIVFSVVSQAKSAEVVKRVFKQAKMVEFVSVNEAQQAVLDGKAHAFAGSSPQPEFLALRNPEVIDMPLSKPVVAYMAGFGVQKGQQEWLNFLNAWIVSRTSDKWLSATHKHWFASLNWQEEAKR